MPGNNKTADQKTATGWRIVALSGTTADGRTISPEDLNDMAAGYNPEKYTARINLEHLRFVFPYPEVSGYGDVVALKTEKQGGKTALLARLAVNNNLQALWDADQKVFSSIEIIKPFADTGKAYLAGLAVTDYPASLGTSRHFSVSGTAAVAAAQSIHFSEYTEMTQNTEQPSGLFAALLAKFVKAEPEAAAEIGTEVPSAEAEKESADVSKLSADLAAAKQELADAAKFSADLLQAHQQLRQDFDQLKASVENTAASGQRAPHTGSTAAVKSDF